jgi:heme exporter protein D
MKEFFAMGGYAFFVWTSYALALIVLVVNIILPLRRRRQLIAQIGRRARRERKQA